MVDFSILLQGFILALGMFVCPGPKDLLILQLALQRRNALVLVFVGVASDALLIVLGMLGLSAALRHSPALRLVAMWAAFVLLLLHAATAFARLARSRPGAAAVPGRAAARHTGGGLRSVVLVSLFNPAAWLDTVVVIGGTGAVLEPHLQAGFVAGAVAASAAWFAMVVAAGCSSRQMLTSSNAWRAVDAIVGVAMLAVAASIARDLW